MDLRGMPDDFVPTVEFNDRMYGVYTASPGRITAFNGTLATVQITVQFKTIKDGKVVYLDPPPVTNVPVVLPSSTGAGVFITVPIQIGDPCLLIFGQRGIDNVVNGDGKTTAPPPDTQNALLSRIRHHDMADAICIPGLLCQHGAPANWNMSGIELRNASESVFVRVTAAAIQTQGPWTHTGPMNVQGDIKVTVAGGGGGHITAVHTITGGTG
jgi:hypothetical protein